jgi:hypothetical protein
MPSSDDEARLFGTGCRQAQLSIMAPSDHSRGHLSVRGKRVTQLLRQYYRELADNLSPRVRELIQHFTNSDKGDKQEPPSAGRGNSEDT